MQMRSGAVPAARGQADLLPSGYLLADDDNHAVFLQVNIGCRLAVAVIDLDVIRRQRV